MKSIVLCNKMGISGKLATWGKLEPKTKSEWPPFPTTQNLKENISYIKNIFFKTFS